MLMRYLIIYLFWSSVDGAVENVLNPPFGCTSAGYCYPDFRTSNAASEYVCTNCTCPIGTTKTAETICTPEVTCLPTSCPITGEWQCTMNGMTPICSCKPGFTGSDCTIAMTSPCAVDPCLSRGVCTAVGSDYQCVCQAGTYGLQCQYDGEPCGSKCQNGGNCTMMDKETVPVCSCDFGWMEDSCQKAVAVDSDYINCFDDKSFTYNPAIYFLYSSSSAINTGKKCFDALSQYRKLNPDSTYMYSTLSGGSPPKCYFSDTQIQSVTPSCTIQLLCDLLTALLDTCRYGTPSKDNSAVYKIVDPCVGDPCNEVPGWGFCVPTAKSSYRCECFHGRTGASCQSVAAITPCASVSCGTGTCQVTDDSYGAFCFCPDGSKSVTPCATDPCLARPCRNGGSCTSSGSDYSCSCLNLYGGTNCEVFQACYENQCENGGSCSSNSNLLDSTFTCNCTAEWRGARCEIEVFPCDFEPCENDAQCINIAVPVKDYVCNCTKGWEGRNCETDIDECVVLGPNLCTSKDPTATCTNLLHGEYKCNCGPNWMGPNCKTNKIVYDILNATYGYVNDDDLDKLTEDLMNDPTIVRDLVPFLIGGYPTDTRTDLSWDYEDMFIWVAYEDKLINIRSDFVRWNDKVLGNCFTFNHMNSSTIYQARVTGFPGGLELQTNLQEREYLPWIETAAIMVFTHSNTESIFAESPRINCRGNHIVNIDVFPQTFNRMGGKYGKCVMEKGEVFSYYYGGTYTTDGCIRSCYQDVLKRECGCMDPRYPMPEDEISCGLSKRMCIEGISSDRGDPSKWPECQCPLPCNNAIYEVGWSEESYSNAKLVCSSKTGNEKDDCMESESDMVLLKAGMPMLNSNAFIETPAMDMVTFISRMGGLMGILMGISFICFIEFFFLFAQVGLIMLANKKLSFPTPRRKAGALRNNTLYK